MPEADARIRWEDDLAAEIVRYIQANLSVVERKGLFARVYLAELMAEIGAVPAASNLAMARAEVEHRLPWRLFRDVLRPGKATSSEFARKQAELVAARSAAGWKREFRRYNSEISIDDAPRYGYISLVELDKSMRSADPLQPEVRNPEAFLAQIVRRQIQKDIDPHIRHTAPRTHYLYRRSRKREKELKQHDPHIDERACAEKATEEAIESINRTIAFLDRVEYEEAAGDGQEESGYDNVLEEDLLETLEQIVARRPFTPTDYDTWHLWRAADLKGRDIDWLGLRGLTGNTGPQRLLQLLEKLRGFLGRDFF